MKKETCWDLSINTEAGDGNGVGGSATKSTPRKRTPSKKAAMKAENGDASDDDEEFVTPSKKAKTALNKVKGGRVAKGRGKNGAAPVSYVEIDDENEDEDAGEDDMDVKGHDGHMRFDNTSNGK